ncbi:hypothetical protein [Chitinophaga sp. Cy-1792]|uniref:hypothetical protein n=1 Tax=Chitinophaga sp. Cy-1792 TaxID=2608339 RepID=UPI001423EFB8|nr:hypothetical protein [Chitinophaga sp. Cy-1792]NIG55858.1 hypothetical protein [Chitinophaga sp. Cy-1792]
MQVKIILLFLLLVAGLPSFAQKEDVSVRLAIVRDYTDTANLKRTFLGLTIINNTDRDLYIPGIIAGRSKRFDNSGIDLPLRMYKNEPDTVIACTVVDWSRIPFVEQLHQVEAEKNIQAYQVLMPYIASLQVSKTAKYYLQMLQPFFLKAHSSAVNANVYNISKVTYQGKNPKEILLRGNFTIYYQHNKPVDSLLSMLPDNWNGYMKYAPDSIVSNVLYFDGY